MSSPACVGSNHTRFFTHHAGIRFRPARLRKGPIPHALRRSLPLPLADAFADLIHVSIALPRQPLAHTMNFLEQILIGHGADITWASMVVMASPLRWVFAHQRRGFVVFGFGD